jgi:glycosyltransferase involved in cell wall biosynthesis
MRVLYHHRTRCAGVERVHILGIARALRAMGHDVDIMSVSGLQSAEDAAAPVSKPGWKWRAFHAVTTQIPEFVFEILELAYNIVAGVRLWRYIRTRRPDLLYERYSLFMCLGVWMARRFGIPVILEVNDSAVVERVRPLFLVHLARRIEGWIFRNCRGIVFVSRQFQREVQAHFRDMAPSIVSPNAVDIAHFTPTPSEREQMRRELGVEGKVVCGYVGAFVMWHGIDWFVKEIAERLRAHPDLVLLLVGDGKLYAEIRDFVRENKLEHKLLLPGRVPHEQVGRWISAMDYAVLPDSNTYGSPMKVFELMAMGVAVVAPDFDPLLEVIEEGRTGWLFRARDRGHCAERVLALATDRAAQSRVGSAARAYILDQRQWRNNAQQLLGLCTAFNPTA